MDYDKRSVSRAIAEGIAQGVTGQQLTWNQASLGGLGVKSVL